MTNQKMTYVMSTKWGMASIILVMKPGDYPNKQVPLRQNDY